jgi:hypothetical protein
VQGLSRSWPTSGIYCLTILGSISVITLLSPVVLTQTIVLARPYLEGGPTPLSLMQRRELEAALSLPPPPKRVKQLVPAEPATVSLEIYAARLDAAEKEDPSPTTLAFELESEPSSIASERTKLRVARADPRYSRLTAGDIFNRSFGVITAAAN